MRLLKTNPTWASDLATNDRAYISWIMLCFLATYVPLECFAAPPFASAMNAARLCLQLAWLVPMAPVWRWNAALRWNRLHFLNGLVAACGLFAGLIILPDAFDDYASPWSIARAAYVILGGLCLGFTAALYALKARNGRSALVIGLVVLAAQMASEFLALLAIPMRVV